VKLAGRGHGCHHDFIESFPEILGMSDRIIVMKAADTIAGEVSPGRARRNTISSHSLWVKARLS
jgi:hypothetical protein